MGLKIGDIFSVRPFFSHHGANLVKLLPQRKVLVTGKIAASLCRAVGTAAVSLGSIDIRAGKSCIQRDFCYLTAKFLFQEIVEGVIALIGV